jgi:hypothetical protein
MDEFTSSPVASGGRENAASSTALASGFFAGAWWLLSWDGLSFGCRSSVGGRVFISSVRKTHPGGILHATARALLRYTALPTEPGSSVESAADEGFRTRCAEDEEDDWRDWAGHARRAEGNSKHATAIGMIRVESNLIVQ